MLTNFRNSPFFSTIDEDNMASSLVPEPGKIIIAYVSDNFLCKYKCEDNMASSFLPEPGGHSEMSAP
jgi:hypothetical protein